MDTIRRLLAAALVAMLSLFAVACGDGEEGGGDEAIEQEEDNGDDNGDD